VAEGRAVTALSEAAQDYLRLRRSLGHDLAEAHRLLPRFVAYLDGAALPTVTLEAALAWSQQPAAAADTSVWSRRMTIVRGFAKYMVAFDPRTQVPPLGLLPSRQRWRPPFIYTPSDIEALLTHARSVRGRLPAATHTTVLALLAVTGMRVGEALRLDRGDIDWAEGVLLIRESKFGKSRYVPVASTTLGALDRYARLRDRICTNPQTPSFFVSVRGARLIYAVVQQVFRRLCDTAGIGVGSPTRPRLHDLRHTFAVRTLLEWYAAGDHVEPRLPALSTYLGHRDPRSTYWYLSAAPELLALAADRLVISAGASAR
jgi:integrase/recombinase XerD